MTIQRRDGTSATKEITDFKDSPLNNPMKQISLKGLRRSTKRRMEDNYRKLSKPILLTNFFVNHPFLWLLIVFIILGSITGVVFYRNWFAVSPVNSRDFLIWDDPKTINFDKSTLARSMLVSGGTGGNSETPLQSSVEIEWTMFLIYE